MIESTDYPYDEDSNLIRLLLHDSYADRCNYVAIDRSDIAWCQLCSGDDFAIIASYHGRTFKISTDFTCAMCLFRSLKGNDTPCEDCYQTEIEEEENNG